MYLDTSYLAKLYLPEPESDKVEKLVAPQNSVRTSALALVEFHSILHRLVNQGEMTEDRARSTSAQFLGHVTDGFWELLPITEQLLRRTSAIVLAAPQGLYVRAGDAIHLVTAAEAGEKEIWTSDRGMLTAAPGFGLVGRSI